MLNNEKNMLLFLINRVNFLFVTDQGNTFDISLKKDIKLFLVFYIFHFISRKEHQITIHYGNFCSFAWRNCSQKKSLGNNIM